MEATWSICPGRHFSNDALFFLAASLLATYDVAAPKDEDGNVIPLKLEALEVGFSPLSSEPSRPQPILVLYLLSFPVDELIVFLLRSLTTSTT